MKEVEVISKIVTRGVKCNESLPTKWHSFFLEITKRVLRSYKNEISCAFTMTADVPYQDASTEGQPRNPARPSPPLM